MARPNIEKLYVMIDMLKKATNIDTKCMAEVAELELDKLFKYIIGLESKLYRIQKALEDEIRT